MSTHHRKRTPVNVELECSTFPLTLWGKPFCEKPSHIWTYSFNESQLWGAPFPLPSLSIPNISTTEKRTPVNVELECSTFPLTLWGKPFCENHRIYEHILLIKANCGGHPFLFLPFQSPTSPPQKKDSSKRRTRMLNIPIDPLGETLLWKPPHLWTYSFNESQLWGVPFPSPKKLDFEAFYIKNFKEKKSIRFDWNMVVFKSGFLPLHFPPCQQMKRNPLNIAHICWLFPLNLWAKRLWKPLHP